MLKFVEQLVDRIVPRVRLLPLGMQSALLARLDSACLMESVQVWITKTC